MSEFSSIRSIKKAIRETGNGPMAVYARLSRYGGDLVQVSNARSDRAGSLFITPVHTSDWIEVGWGEVFIQHLQTDHKPTLLEQFMEDRNESA